MALQDVFIANMRKYRKQAHFTQERLAELCDTDPRYIGQIENGRRFPSVSYIEKIAAALSVAPYRLFYDETRRDDDPGAAARSEQKQKITAILTESISRICALSDGE
ncbi:MAG: helix-turn-helix domain-containing protein [Spirochaetaceae bacterium]|jgi:transcriptional regulator with XRE-family HTH domain|nr:helix-turn-helix domain-containing protein [Spirochaetaceae bacterium]